MVKIKDIAKAANVSPATVSRILRNDPLLSVRDETRDEVIRIAEEMGYKRTVKKTKGTSSVGIVQWISKYQEDTDPYYYELRKAVETSLNRLGYHVQRYYREDIESIYTSQSLIGLICVGKFSLDQAAKLKNGIKHIIFVDSNPDANNYSSVVFDFVGATYRVMDHLIEKGHRNIGFIGGREYIGPEKQEYLDKREMTFLKIMNENSSLRMIDSNVYINDFTAQTGYEGIINASKSDNMASAFVCESDTIAMGAISALAELKLLNNEKHVSIISYNDIYNARYLNPALTTIKLDIKAMAEHAAYLLDYSIKAKNLLTSKTTLPTKLIIRDSVKSI